MQFSQFVDHAFRVTTLAFGLTALAAAADDPTPPAQPVKLVFIHHSTGEAWLDDSHGRLGITLRDNNYFVSDTNYGWGPGSIGDTTDIGDWWTWFRGPSATTYLNAVFSESGQNCSYSRMGSDPGGANTIVMFKSCFPNSALGGDPNGVPPPIGSNPLRGQGAGSSDMTVANAKGIYIDLLECFRLHPDKLFIVITAPPLSDATDSSNARAFNEWLVNSWLLGYLYNNVFVFDFYNVLTTNGGNANTNDLGQTGGNHHRWVGGVIQHKTDGDNDSNPNVLEYASGDDHPSAAGDLKASAEYAPLLNIAYHRFAGSATGFGLSVGPSSVGVPPGGSIGATVTVTSIGGFSGSVTLAASGLPSGVTADFSQNPVVPTGTSLVTFHASSTAAVGSYTVTLTGTNGGTQHTATVDLVVADGPIPSVTPATLHPAASAGTDAATQEFTVRNIGTGTLNYEVHWDATWLSCDSSGGSLDSGTDTIHVSYATASMGAGDYHAAITVTGAGTSAEVGVDLSITAAGTRISGTILNATGAPLAGVKLTFSNNGGKASTDSQGNYSRTVKPGWSGTVTPKKNGYKFTPPRTKYSKVACSYDQDYTGSKRR